jgi:hypothetical protein
MTKTIDLLSINPELENKKAFITDFGSVVFEDRTFPNLIAFQNFLKYWDKKYMIIDPEESNEPD